MKQKLLFAAATAALMAAPSLAAAQDSGWYLRGNAGYGTHTDGEFSGGFVGDVESEGNAALSLGLGYEFDNNWRLETDASTLWTDLGAIGQQPSSFAKLRTNNFMLNAIYDFDEFGNWEPYVGAGVGLVRASLSAQAHDFSPGFNGPTAVLAQNPACPGAFDGFNVNSCEVDGNDTGLGWQVLAGLGYDITDNLTWDTHYKYFDTSELDFVGTRSSTAGTVSDLLTTLDGVGGHSLMTGFRYRFGGATPPPPPPPPTPTADFQCWDGSMVFNANQCPPEVVAPVADVQCWDGSMVFNAAECPAQPTYKCWDGSIVSDLSICPAQTRSGQTVASLCGSQYRQEIIYYEFDKGQSAETRNTINRILDIGQFCQVDNIRVVGHTDSSGSAAYNLALSKRRAKDAADELVRQGISSAVISSEGKGETELFVQTGDGVKEQLNRRTEVLISLSETGGVIN